MIDIQLDKIGKRFRYEWIFKNIEYNFNSTKNYAVKGKNGSGKSTLMNILSGFLTPSKGSITFKKDDNVVDNNDIYKDIAYCAPYIELVEEFTLKEMIDFHYKFKKMKVNKELMLSILNYSSSTKKKIIKHFSSGMKQRLKLALNILSNSSVLLLDEPTVTLDNEAMHWYKELMNKYADVGKRLVIIASNVDFDFMEDAEVFEIARYKK